MVDEVAWPGRHFFEMAKARRIRRASARTHRRRLDQGINCQWQRGGDTTADRSQELEAAEPKRWIKVSAPLPASSGFGDAWAAQRGLNRA